MIYYSPQPILLQIGFFKAYSYGFMLALAFLLDLFLILRQARKQKIQEKHIYSLFFFIVLSAMIFSRLFYFIFNFGEFNSLLEFFEIWKGGSFGIGAIIGGIFGGFVYCKKAKLNFLAMLNLFAPYLALTIALGRIGCFLRGCCFGIPTNLPWGILYTSDSLAVAAGFTGIPLHPTQLYHFLADILIFFFLFREQNRIKNQKPGKLFLLFLLLFSAERFIIDFIRYYPAKYHTIMSLTVFQIVYGLVFIFSLIWWIALRKKREATKKK